MTFSYERHAKAALFDLGRPLLARLALAVKTGRGAPPRFRGSLPLRAQRAPEPSDVQWGNVSVRGARRLARHAAALALTLLVLAAGGVMQWGFNRAKEDQRVRLLQLEVSGVSGSSSDVYRLRGLSAANGLAIVLVNSFVQYLLPKLNDFERFRTYSSLETVYVWKLTVFQLLNTILVPLIVARRTTWYVRGGLVEQAFYIQVFNCALTDAAKLFDPYYFLCARHATASACSNTHDSNSRAATGKQHRSGILSRRAATPPVRRPVVPQPRGSDPARPRRHARPARVRRPALPPRSPRTPPFLPHAP